MLNSSTAYGHDHAGGGDGGGDDGGGDCNPRSPKCAGLDAFIVRTGADEIMVAAHIYDPAARIRSYELLAEAMQ